MSGLICPHCGTATAFQPKNLKPQAFKQAQHFSLLQGCCEDGSIFALAIVEGSKTSYALSVCASCSEIFLATKANGRDWVASFPIPAINVPEEIPAEIRSAFQEAKLSYAIKAYQACLMMCRTALVRLQRHQGVGKEGLKALYEQGKISLRLYQMADEVREWANAVGHEDIPAEGISQQDCEELLTYMDNLLNELYIAPAKLKQLTDKRKDVSKQSKTA